MSELDPIIRLETEGDRAAIHEVNSAAFGRADEAELVDNLRREGAVLASIVAEVDGRVVGHVLFSRMFIETQAGPVEAAALAPVAVLPEFQRRAIGGTLIRHGLELLRRQGERIAIVLGWPEYYPRFGFSVEKAAGLESPFPREAYMALELSSGALDGVRGKVKYAAAFGL